MKRTPLLVGLSALSLLLSCKRVIQAVAADVAAEVVVNEGKQLLTPKEWQPGMVHPRDPYVIASDLHGLWTLKPGHTWKNTDTTEPRRLPW